MPERGVSEVLGVGVLVGFVVIILLSLGTSVVLNTAQQQDPGEAEITFDRVGDALVITYNDNYVRTAGSVYIDGPDNNVSWAQLSSKTGEEDVIPSGDRIQASQNDEYGYSVGEEDTFEVIYIEDGERYVLGTWGRDSVGEEVDVERPSG
jgi:hypothetical protein